MGSTSSKPAQQPVLDKFSFGLEKTSIRADDATLRKAIVSLADELSEESTHNMCVGLKGAGKSSFLNTIASILKDRFYRVAAQGEGQGSITTEMKPHVLERHNKAVNWKWTDTPGDMISDEYRDKNAVLDRKVFQYCIKEEIWCITIVISATSLQKHGHDDMLKLYHDLNLRARKHNRNIIVVITMCDKADATIMASTTNICWSKTVNSLKSLVCREIGVDKSQVYPVVNLTEEKQPIDNLAKCWLALPAVYNALGSGSAVQPQHIQSAQQSHSTEAAGTST